MQTTVHVSARIGSRLLACVYVISMCVCMRTNQQNENIRTHTQVGGKVGITFSRRVVPPTAKGGRGADVESAAGHAVCASFPPTPRACTPADPTACTSGDSARGIFKLTLATAETAETSNASPAEGRLGKTWAGAPAARQSTTSPTNKKAAACFTSAQASLVYLGVREAQYFSSSPLKHDYTLI